MIEFVNVTKIYKLKGVKKVILDNFSFKFPENRNVAIMGHNGVGKSTFMRLMAGAESPDRGTIYRSSNISWPLGFAGGFNGVMTGLENILFVARIYGKDTEEIIDYVKNFSELGKSLKLPIRTYSSGMKARLAFGLSMAINFDCYLIDEVTAVGDQKFKLKCKEVFEEKLNKSQIIMISHSISSIRENCDCGLLLTREGIFYYDELEDLLSDYKKSALN